MPDLERQPMEKRSVSLLQSQWAWLKEQSDRNFSRSSDAELRRVVAAAMDEEAAVSAKAA